MNERIVYFGEDRNLLGVVTLPDAPSPGAPAVILLNAGLLHRVGPNRLYVEIARKLAGDGYPCLRFDMAGVGDSKIAEGDVLYIERARQDVIDSMDAMEETVGVGEFVLMGLCTGAYNAFRTGLADERVVGCALLDGYSYPTLRSHLADYGRRVLELDRWVRYIKRLFGSNSQGDGTVQGDLVVFENEVVPKDRFARELTELVERHTQLLLIYTGLGPLRFTYPRQMHDAFRDIDLDSCATVHFYPEADHTFTLPGHRARLLDDIGDWMRTRFAGVLER